MSKPLVFKQIAKFIGFAAVIPLLIGHGLSSAECTENCTKSEVPSVDIAPYILSGSESSDSDIEIGGRLYANFLDDGFDFESFSTDDSISPFKFEPTYSPSNEDGLKINVNGLYDKVPDRVGKLWLHDSNGGSIKLLHDAISPSYLSMIFTIDGIAGFNEEQNSSIESSSMYMLAGGKVGSEYIKIDASLDIYINNRNIYSKEFILDDFINPIVFQAMPGDKLRFVASRVYSRETNDFDNVSALWLFTPSGDGIKLLHAGKNNYSEGTFIDMTYILP